MQDRDSQNLVRADKMTIMRVAMGDASERVVCMQTNIEAGRDVY